MHTVHTTHTHTHSHSLFLVMAHNRFPFRSAQHSSRSPPLLITHAFSHTPSLLSAPPHANHTHCPFPHRIYWSSHEHSQIPTFVCHECVANQRTAQVSTTSSNIRASASTALHTAAFACHVLIRLAPTQRTRCHPSSWSQGPVQGVQVVERFQRVA